MDPSPASSSPQLYTRAFVIAVLSQSLFVMGNTLMIHHTRWVKSLGGTESDVGYVMGFGAIVGLIVRPWMAQWINRIGARNMWGIGYLVFAVGSVSNLLVHDLNLSVYVVRTVFVFGGAIVFASSLTYVTQISPRERRTEAIGIVGAGGFIGMLVGPFLGDILIQGQTLPATAGIGVTTGALASGLAATTGIGGSMGALTSGLTVTTGMVSQDFSGLFLLAACFMVLPGFLLLLLPATRLSEKPSTVKFRDFLRIIQNHWPGMILLVDIAFGLCMTVPFGFLATFIDVEQLVIPGVSVIGLYFWSYAGWGLTVRVGLRKLPDQVGRRKILLVGMLFMTAGMFSYLLVDSSHVWLIMVPAFICGTGHALMFHTMTALTLERFPYEVRGTGSTFSLMALESGMICGAPILGVIAHHKIPGDHNYYRMFVVLGIFVAGVMLLYFWSSISVWKERARVRRENLAA